MANTGKRFGRAYTWQRKIEGQYYLFQLNYEQGVIRVFKNMYNAAIWEDEWVLVHEYPWD